MKKRERLEIKARAGDAEAIVELARDLYYRRPHNTQMSRYWLNRAAKIGNPEAQYLYGILLRDGEGGPRRLKESVRWFRASAAQDSPDGAYCLAFALHCGMGTPID